MENNLDRQFNETSGTFRENENVERVMDSEEWKKRGIAILAKPTSISGKILE